MKYGFIKVASATPSVRICDCQYNANQIIDTMRNAHSQGIRVLVLPELSVTGYTCGDLFLQNNLLDDAISQLFNIAKSTEQFTDMLTFVGLPLRSGQNLFNCSAAILNGKILGIIPKTFIPNYNEFYEKRHFSEAPSENGFVTLNGVSYPFGSKLIFRCENMPEFCVATEICEDLWVPCSPSVNHAAAGATIIANLSSSNETVGKDVCRRNLVLNQSSRLKCGYIYSSSGQGESTTDLVFSAHNIIAENGQLLAQSKLFEGNIIISEIDVNLLFSDRVRKNSFCPNKPSGSNEIPFQMNLYQTEITRNIDKSPFLCETYHTENPFETILNIQAFGLKKRIEHSFAKTAVIGISGGLDSCLALLVAARTMDLLKRPRTDIIAITMPCFGTTERTLNNSEKLSNAMGATFMRIDISNSVINHFSDIGQASDKYDVVYENAQARERTQVLMDIANKTGGLVVGTGDMSELALGWATYNGDHMSMYGVNSSVPKTLVYKTVLNQACAYGNENLKAVLEDILDTPVSPELLPSSNGEICQKTEDIIGPYELHDFFMYYMLRYGFSPSKIYHMASHAFKQAYQKQTILKCLKYFYKRFFAQQFKRSCIPDGPKVFSVGLSPRGDLRMPSDACSNLWLSELEKIEP